MSIQVTVLSYGSYSEDELIAAGRRAVYGVLLDPIETQASFVHILDLRVKERKNSLGKSKS